MCTSYLLPACYVILISVAVMGAPLNEKASEEKKRSTNPVVEVEDQEKDLQGLLNLVNTESHQDNVMVHKAEMSHVENDNGQTMKVEEAEEKVIDTNTGDVIADVKQEVKQEDTGNGEKPETVVETKVDIPSEDVHETFVQDGESNSEEQADTDDIEPDLTPADMAEYLYATQQFDAFYSALDSLINQSKMTPEDAEVYARTVALEYEKLQLEEYEDRLLTEKRLYPQAPVVSDVYGQVPISDVYPMAGPAYTADDRYPPVDFYGYPPSYVSPEELYLAQQQQQQQQQMEDSYANDIDPFEFLAALWNEAYGKGDEEAQEIVKMLYDRVSQDDNPDDMGQIRDLLIETVAASLNQDPMLYPEVPEEGTNQQAPVQEEAEPVDNEGGAEALEQLEEAEQEPEVKPENVKKDSDSAKSEAVSDNKADQQKQ